MHKFRLLGVLIVAMVVLSGCYKMDISLEISADDTVDGTFIMAFNSETRAQLDAMSELGEVEGLSDSQLAFDQDQLEAFGDRAKVEPYEEGDWGGEKLTFSDVALADLGDILAPPGSGEGQDGLTITHEDGEYRFSATIDTSALGTGFDDLGELGELMDEEQQQEARQAFEAMLQDATMTMTVTFPGKVTSANGTIDGRSVTWDLLNADEATGGELQATAAEPTAADRADAATKKASDAATDAVKKIADPKGDGSSIGLWIGVGVAVVVLAGAGIALLARRGKKA